MYTFVIVFRYTGDGQIHEDVRFMKRGDRHYYSIEGDENITQHSFRILNGLKIILVPEEL